MKHVKDEPEVNEDLYDQPGHVNPGNTYFLKSSILIDRLYTSDINSSLCVAVKIGKCIVHFLTINPLSYDLLVYANILTKSLGLSVSTNF